MKRNVMTIGFVLIAILLALPAMSQPRYDYGAGYDDEYYSSGPWTERGWGPVWGPGHGMGRGGMMGYGIYAYVPQKLPVPKNKEWVEKLSEILALERLSLEQYATDSDKYNTYMPYHMVIPQEQDHVMAIERLFAAYGLPPDGGKVPTVKDTKTLDEAYQLCVKMERDLIPRYEWLIKNAEDRDTKRILNNVLLQTRYHLAMFEHALQAGGWHGGGRWGWRGHGSGMMWNR
jgi:rubrerythrin